MSPAPPTAYPLDADAVEELRLMMGDDEMVREVAATFAEEAPALLAEVEEAVATGDAASLQHAAHTLKSNLALFGARTLAAHCLALEALGAAGRVDGADADLTALRQGFPAARDAVAAL